MRIGKAVRAPVMAFVAVLAAACSQGADVDWATYGLDHGETRQSPLAQINANTISGLKPVWVADLTDISNRAFEATPLVVDGVMYVSTGWSNALAFDAVTGKELWRYDPQVSKDRAGRGCCGPVSRGVAYHDGKVFLAAFDGRLIALDARSGTPVWTAQTIDPTKDYTVTGAPRVVDGLVVIGNGGAELGVRGYVSAYDAQTGEMVWRFYTVPPKPGTTDGEVSDAILEQVSDGWAGTWWELGGGGTAWDAMAYDPELDLLYIGVGNGGPWSRELRSDGQGDNLFLSSIVAVRPKTGEYVWHFQTTPGDEWDYTATQSIILSDILIDGKPRKVLMQAPKNGFFYVLDRETGAFLSGEPYVTVTWAKGLDPETGRPIEADGIRWSERGETSNQLPGPSGGHNWQPMSYSTKTGLAYIPTLESGFGYAPAGADYQFYQGAPNMGIDPVATSLPPDINTIIDARKGVYSELLAWDPVKQKPAWRIKHPIGWNGGTLVTDGGLVFQGDAMGDLVAFDAGSGEKLWSMNLGAGIVAPPMTYMVDGVQYLAIAVGWGGGMTQVAGGITAHAKVTGINRLVVLALDGEGVLPPVPIKSNGTLNPPPATASATTVAAGRALYERRCYFCHGSAAVSGGAVPDLRHSATLADAAGWAAIVRDGALAANGMPAFARDITPEAAEAIRAFVIERANHDKAALQGAQGE